ncbi:MULTISPECIES: hypothetical protein [Actinomadura]|uniref:DUF305 domain-containing protein n=1 Tax=Actinomadura yumaensis TaxID=111807 RepID=A0ABW2CRU9_9ACTN|nr:hypothetical protein [Actinomadura sp. J1-007]
MPRTVADPDLLGVYLNDHLAGATGGLELARRTAGSHRGGETGAALKRIADEIREDREALLAIMVKLGVPVRRYKVYAAWAAEKAGRLKLNGRLASPSPLSGLVELEMLRLGTEGKAAGWSTLRELADADARLDARRLDELIARARAQSRTLEELRVKAAAGAFTTSGPSARDPEKQRAPGKQAAPEKRRDPRAPAK